MGKWEKKNQVQKLLKNSLPSSTSLQIICWEIQIKKNANDLDIEKVKESLKKSLGYNGTSDIPEDELESMAQAFIEHFKNQ